MACFSHYTICTLGLVKKIINLSNNTLIINIFSLFLSNRENVILIKRKS